MLTKQIDSFRQIVNITPNISQGSAKETKEVTKWIPHLPGGPTNDSYSLTQEELGAQHCLLSQRRLHSSCFSPKEKIQVLVSLPPQVKYIRDGLTLFPFSSN